MNDLERSIPLASPSLAKDGSHLSPPIPVRESVLSRLAPDGELDLRNLLLTLWRRKLIIIITSLLITVLATLTVFQLTPQYTSSAKAMLETRQAKVSDIENVISGASPEMATVLSEVEVIRSSSLIRRVVEKLNLTQDPEFNSELREKTWYADFLNLETYVPKDFLITMGIRRYNGELSPEEAREQTQAAVVDALMGQLSVTPIRRSLVINISVTSDDPRKAALIANTIAENYVVDQLEAKFEATKRASNWLNDRIVGLKQTVLKAETAVETYRSQVASQVGQRTKLTMQQISELNTQLILAQAKRAEAAARLNQVQGLLESKGEISTAAEVLNSPLIHRLREQEAELLRKVSELESRYGERHPKMVKAKAELRDQRRSIENEVRKIAQSLRNEMQVAQARERTLDKNLKRLEATNVSQDRAAIRLRELEREAQANRLLYENFLGRFKETAAQEDLQQADARIISKAEVAKSPSYPKKKLTILLMAFGGLFLGIVLVFVLERLDNTFRGAEDLEARTGVATIGMVPLVTAVLKTKNLGKYLTEKPASSVSESVRSLRTAIALSNVDKPPQVIGVTSSVPGEGKSTISVWLAQVCASGGQKVLLFDGDLRRPTVHKVMGVDNARSVVDLLAGNSELSEVMTQIGETSLYVMPAKVTDTNALDMLGSERMAKYVNAMREHFDIIVIDCPPILAVSDAKIIGQLTDKMLYAVKWDSTPRGLVTMGLKSALEAGLDIAGTVLTQVNVRKHARYGYDDYGYYYGKYKSYYTS